MDSMTGARYSAVAYSYETADLFVFPAQGVSRQVAKRLLAKAGNQRLV